MRSREARVAQLRRSQEGAFSLLLPAQRFQRSRNRLHRGSTRRAEVSARHAARLECLGQPRLEHLLVRRRWRAKRRPCARVAAAARRRTQDGTAGERGRDACACASRVPWLQQTAVPLEEATAAAETAEAATTTAAATAATAAAETLDWCTGTHAHGVVAHPAPRRSKAVRLAALWQAPKPPQALFGHLNGEVRFSFVLSKRGP